VRRNISTPDEEPPSQGERMRRLMVQLGRSRTLRDPMAAAGEAMPFTPPQIHTLMQLLDLGEPQAMGDLAHRLGISEKTVTGLVDRLEREGHVHRLRGSGDRRVVQVQLTKRGAQAADRIRRTVAEKMDRLLGLLDAEDREALFRVMKNLIRRLEEQRTEAGETAGEEGHR